MFRLSILAAGLCLFPLSALGVYNPPPLAPGWVLPWHAGVQVSTYSNVNTFNGNLFTALPVVSWSGVGPDLNFALFHNSANWNQTPEDTKHVGFFLGSGWSTSYSDRLIITGTPTVIWADGTRATFNQAGFHDVLEHDALDPNFWRIKHQNQSYHEFQEFNDGVVRLIRVVDAQGYATTITYETYEYEKITYYRLQRIIAAGRQLDFVYDTLAEAPGTKLIRIDSPGYVDLPFPGVSSPDRSWVLGYTPDDNGHTWFTSLDDPIGNRISFTYDHSCSPLSPCGKNYRGRLTTVTDKYDPDDPNDPNDPFTTPDVFKHTYYVTPSAVAGKSLRTCDPGCNDACGNTTTCAKQKMIYSAVSPGYITNKYYDRRGNEWTYYFNNSDTGQNLYPDGNLTDFVDPTGFNINLFYDADRNAIYLTDYVSGYWSREFDANGNLTYVEDPLLHGAAITYDQYNNVTSVTDAAGNTTRNYYDEAHDVFWSYCTNYPQNGACELRCEGGSNDDDLCEHDGECPGGSCEPQDSGCKRCAGGTNANLPCAGAGDCPGSTCNQGTCLALETQPWLSTLLTRIVEPGPSGNPPADQAPGQEGTYPVTRLVYHVESHPQCVEISGDRYNCHGQLMEIIDPNEVWTGFQYDIWGQQTRYMEGRFDTQVATTILGDQCNSIEDSSGCRRSGGSSGGACSESECDANGNSTSNDPSDECVMPDGIGRFLRVDPFVPAGFPVRPCAAPDLLKLTTSFANATYSPKGYPLSLPLRIHPDGGTTAVNRDFSYSTEFQSGLAESTAAIASKEFDGSNSVTREFAHEGDLVAGTYLRTGPDGVDTYVEFDAANRVSCMRRGPATGTGNGPVMEAEYTYSAGLLDSISYGNGLKLVYVYDAARRLTEINRIVEEEVIESVHYTYTADNLPEIISQSDAVGTNQTTFTYDNRRRLVHEVLSAPFGVGYDIEYEYDDGGNRLVKTDNQAEFRTEYHYDTLGDDGDAWEPGDYMSNYNRLQYYEVYDTSGQSDSLFSTTWYYYVDDDTKSWGNPKRIVTEYESDPGTYHSIRFGYAYDRRTVSYVVGETWDWTAPATCEATNSYQILWAREFRYDSGRARYLYRELDADDLEQGTYTVVSQTWTDYDGDQTYGDYSLAAGNPLTVTNLRSYQPGMAETDPWVADGADNTNYLITDHLGTVRYGQTTQLVYTAFGERISGENPRFGYVGAFGYQSHSISEAADPDKAFPFLHVGARYYDPSSGRFLQRDPIGILGGINSYVYLGNLPTVDVDPEGTSPGTAGGRGCLRTYDPWIHDPQHPWGPDWAVRRQLEKRNREAQEELQAARFWYMLRGGDSDLVNWVDNQRRRRQVQFILKVPATITLWIFDPWGAKIVLRTGSIASWFEEGKELFCD